MQKIDRIDEERLNDFGSRMIIIKYKSCVDIDVYFPEYNWTFEHATYNNFKKGTIKCPYERRVFGVAYIGEGKYKKHHAYYVRWYNMLKRCYDPYYINKHLTYINVVVCDEWLNFQNFAEWLKKNYYEIPGEEMNLDKDILIKGNKIYSSNTCCLVPQSINKLFIKCNKSRGKYPVGVTYNKFHNKFQSQGRDCEGKHYHLGYYSTPEEAFYTYKNFKENIIKNISDKYKEYLPYNVYKALISYKVEIND